MGVVADLLITVVFFFDSFDFCVHPCFPPIFVFFVSEFPPGFGGGLHPVPPLAETLLFSLF